MRLNTSHGADRGAAVVAHAEGGPQDLLRERGRAVIRISIRQPEDIANSVLFLLTTPFATGSTVRLDGGGMIGRSIRPVACNGAIPGLPTIKLG